MTTYQDNTATVENEPIAQQMPVRVIDVDFSMGDSNSASEDMPKLGTKEFEELSRSLDTRPTGYRFVKRAFDMVMSVCVLAVGIILWPIVLVMLIVIAVQTKGFPIYVQERVGQYGRTIRVPKIRTMVADSENVEKYLNEEQLEEWRKERKVTKDPRIVPAGAFLRKTSLDELTNFMVVLTGSMSVIGPRPIVVEETAWYESDLPKVLSVPQGITGWWQCTSRNKATFESGERQKLELEYVSSATVKLDLKIVSRTLGVMFGQKKTGK